MKTKEEINKLKEEYKSLKEKLKELTEEELNEVIGGSIFDTPSDPKNQYDINIYKNNIDENKFKENFKK